MLCPKCGEDYSDSYRKISGSKRKVFGPLDHYMMPYMIKGYYCPNCGVIMEFITTASGNLFYKKAEIKDEKLLYTTHSYWNFLAEKGLIDEFKKFADPENKKKLADADQEDLFEANDKKQITNNKSQITNNK